MLQVNSEQKRKGRTPIKLKDLARKTTAALATEEPYIVPLSSLRAERTPLPKQRSFLNMFDSSVQLDLKTTTDPHKSITLEGKNTVGNYLFDKELGRGSFGTVFLCHDMKTGVEVAIKVFKKRNLKKRFMGKGKNGLTCVKGEI
jgi:hypothetical protein